MEYRTAIVTGASHGIGRAVAARLAAQGLDLVLNCRKDSEELRRLAGELANAHGIRAIAVPGDVGSHDFVRGMFALAREEFGGADVLVNNAGVSYIGLLSEMPVEEWDRLIATNLTGAFYCCREAIPYMVRKKSGCIINISSVWGARGASCEAAYSASKGGLDSLTRSLAKELAPSNVRVNAIACGAIDTRMNARLTAEERAKLEEEIPMGRFGTPQEAAKLAWQILDGPGYLTGQVIALDGAWQ